MFPSVVRAQNASRGASRFVRTEKYQDETPLQQITDPDDLQESQDLYEQNCQETISEFRHFLKERGMTIFDLCIEELSSNDPLIKRSSKKWMKEGGAEHLISVCLATIEGRSSGTVSDAAVEAKICGLAGNVFLKEIERLVQSRKMSQVASECTVDSVTTFDFAKHLSDVQKLAPHLTTLLQNLMREGRENGRRVKNGFSEAGNALEEISGLREDNSELNEEMRESKLAESEEAETSEMEDENEGGADIDSEPPTIGRRTRRQSRKSSQQTMILTTVVSALCFGRSRASNILQVQMGYWLHCSHAPKRVIEVLNQQGICVSYKSIIRVIGSIASDCKAGLRLLVEKYPRSWPCVDNMNFHATVKWQTLANQQQVLNYTAGYVGINPVGFLARTEEQPMFTTGDVDVSKVVNFGPDNLLPNERDESQNRTAFLAGIYESLDMYFSKHMARERDGKALLPVVVKPIHQIPVQKTIAYTLPASNWNEAQISEMVRLLVDTTGELGIGREKLVGKMIMLCGDYLTVRNARYVSFMTSANDRLAAEMMDESDLQTRLDYFEPVAGLFHFKMAILNLLFRVHQGNDMEFGSLKFWMGVASRDTNMWNFKDRTIKDFRKCEWLFRNLTDAHILAAIGAELGAENWEELGEKLATKNWRKLISQVEKKFGNAGLISELREGEKEGRDFIHENAVLLLQHALVFRRFSKSLKSGDSGWAHHCLKYFTIWLQNGVKRFVMKNYRTESLHLMARTSVIWSDEFYQHWLDNCLVNLSGSPTSFIPVDELNELVVALTKAQIKLCAGVTPAKDHYVRHNIARQVLVSVQVREHVYRAIGATRHYNHSSEVDATTDVRKMTEILLRARVFINTPGRTWRSDGNTIDIPESIDLFGHGIAHIMQSENVYEYIRAVQEGLDDEAQVLEEVTDCGAYEYEMD
jgi:hypothetical protein